MSWKNTNKLTCPKCRSVRLRKRGILYGKQRYECKRCGATTLVPHGGHKNS